MELSECATTGAIRLAWWIFLLFAVSPIISVPALSPVAAVPPQKCQDDIGKGFQRRHQFNMPERFGQHTIVTM